MLSSVFNVFCYKAQEDAKHQVCEVKWSEIERGSLGE